MSQRIVTAVFERYESASQPEYLAALFLAFKANDDGAAICVSVEEIASKARISLRTAKAVLAVMVAEQWLSVVPGSAGSPECFAISPAWIAANAI